MAFKYVSACTSHTYIHTYINDAVRRGGGGTNIPPTNNAVVVVVYACCVVQCERSTHKRRDINYM